MVTLEEFVDSRLDGRCYCDVTDTELIINYSGEYPIPGRCLTCLTTETYSYTASLWVIGY